MKGDRMDPYPRPAWAITAWISDDERHVFVELPMKAGGTPYIMRYDASTKGLLDALVVLKARRVEKQSPTAPANYKEPAHQPQVTVISRTEAARKRLYSETTEEQRSAAELILEKLGIGKP
jgi:hypothetical protein